MWGMLSKAWREVSSTDEDVPPDRGPEASLWGGVGMWPRVREEVRRQR